MWNESTSSTLLIKYRLLNDYLFFLFLLHFYKLGLVKFFHNFQLLFFFIVLFLKTIDSCKGRLSWNKLLLKLLNFELFLLPFLMPFCCQLFWRGIKNHRLWFFFNYYWFNYRRRYILNFRFWLRLLRHIRTRITVYLWLKLPLLFHFLNPLE